MIPMLLEGKHKKGISRRYHPGWRGWEKIDNLKGSPNFPASCEADPYLEEEVEDHYRQFYWNRFLGDEIPEQNIAEELSDTAVNLRVGRAVSFLQQGLNVLNRNGTLYADLVVDGALGRKTLGTLKAYLENDRPDILLKIMNVLQGKHYRRASPGLSSTSKTSIDFPIPPMVMFAAPVALGG